MNLATATPVEIDTRAAHLDGKISQLITACAESVDVLRKRGLRDGWIPRSESSRRHTDDEVIGMALLRAMDGFAAGDADFTPRLAALDAMETELRPLLEEAGEIQTEYDRRPWTRYILVPGGHVHAGVQCAGGSLRPSTLRTWFPQFSGLTVAEAITRVGETMCTHCFPDAPVAATTRATPADRCDGSGRSEVRGTYRRGTPGWGTCQGCSTVQSMTPRGLIRAHKTPKFS